MAAVWQAVAHLMPARTVSMLCRSCDEIFTSNFKPNRRVYARRMKLGGMEV